MTTRKSGPRRRPAAMPVTPGALEVYTDGACSGNPGPGGWAWAVADGRRDSGGEAPSTNQRMEIRAASTSEVSTRVAWPVTARFRAQAAVPGGFPRVEHLCSRWGWRVSSVGS